MSEDNSPAPKAPASKAPAAPRVRRISNPRPKKTAAVIKASEEAALEAVAESPAPIIPPPALPEPEFLPDPTPLEESPRGNQDWPEQPETVSESSGNQGENKRKRRRRKGKGGQNPNAQQGNAPEEFQPNAPEQPAPNRPAPPPPQQQHQHSQQQNPRTPVNPEVLAKKAWKIFLAEVSEEGVALISDHDARELSKRCFRLAEIFIEEQGRKIR